MSRPAWTRLTRSIVTAATRFTLPSTTLATQTTPDPRRSRSVSAPPRGLDAPDAGGDGALGRDLHQAELARPLQVRAPAQLRREVADLDDAHTVAVLLAEEGQGAHPERLVEVHLHPGHLDVCLHLLV